MADRYEYYCGNNVLDPTLKANGGKLEFGTPSMCVKKGYGLGVNQTIKNEAEFLRQWGAKYKPLVKQSLYCGDEAKIPLGYDLRATRPQCLGRGYAIGSVAKAKKLRSGRISKKPSKSQSSSHGQQQERPLPVRHTSKP